jgi:hypothetical protein
MKTSVRLFGLAKNGDVESAKALAQALIREGEKQTAIDLYRCIRGDGRNAKYLDGGLVRALATLVEQAENANIAWGDKLLADEGVMAFAAVPGSSGGF